MNCVYKKNVVHEIALDAQPKSRRRQVSEERILEAATRMVLEQGYDALNMKDVADAAAPVDPAAVAAVAAAADRSGSG